MEYIKFNIIGENGQMELKLTKEEFDKMVEEFPEIKNHIEIIKIPCSCSNNNRNNEETITNLILKWLNAINPNNK